MNRILFIFLFILALSCAKKDESEPFSSANPLEKAIFHFKMGETYNNAEESYKAMEEFLEAERWSLELKNDILKGRIYWYKGEIYLSRLDYTNALNMYTLAAEYFESSDFSEDLMATYEKIAIINSKTKKLEDAIIYFNLAKEIALELRDKDLNKYSEIPISDTMSVSKRYNKLILGFSSSISGIYFDQLNSSAEALKQLRGVYDIYNNGEVPEQDFLLLSCIYLDAGDLGEARRYADRYRNWKKRDLSGSELAALLLHESMIEQADGDYKEALQKRIIYSSVMDSITIARQNNSIREMEQRFWQEQLVVENSNMRIQHRYALTIYSMLLLMVILVGYLVIVIYRKRVNKKDAEIEEYIAMVGSLGNKINDVENSKDNLLSQLDIHIEREKHLKDLLENRFAEVRELVRTYYESGNSKKLQNKVNDLLKLQLSGDNFEIIEQVVNAKNNGVMMRIREMFPQMKEDNIKLLNLIYAGFSAQEISVILNDTPQNIYVRKSRLKKSILPLIEGDPQMNFN